MNESLVYLQNTENDCLDEASLFDQVADEHLAMWNDKWVPALQEHTRHLDLRRKPEDSHWDWKKKLAEVGHLLSYQSFALVCKDDLQGLMIINNVKSAKIQEQFGKPIVYVEFVTTAPWNRVEINKPVKYRGVGRIFMLAAIESSRELGYGGRVGLHSLPQAERFYENKCGFKRLGPESTHQNLCYFEMTSSQADLFCQNMK